MHLCPFQMLSNPDMLRQMMDNPFVNQVISNPETLRQIIMSNPQMQQLMEVIGFIYMFINIGEHRRKLIFQFKF